MKWYKFHPSFKRWILRRTRLIYEWTNIVLPSSFEIPKVWTCSNKCQIVPVLFVSLSILICPCITYKRLGKFIMSSLGKMVTNKFKKLFRGYFYLCHLPKIFTFAPTKFVLLESQELRKSFPKILFCSIFSLLFFCLMFSFCRETEINEMSWFRSNEISQRINYQVSYWVQYFITIFTNTI